jgi:hypothetical protein
MYSVNLNEWISLILVKKKFIVLLPYKLKGIKIWEGVIWEGRGVCEWHEGAKRSSHKLLIIQSLLMNWPNGLRGNPILIGPSAIVWKLLFRLLVVLIRLQKPKNILDFIPKIVWKLQSKIKTDLKYTIQKHLIYDPK